MTKIDFSQKLLDDLIAVHLLDKAEGVIKLPDWQRILRGEVVAVGPGRMLEYGERAPMECSVGDVISFAATAGMDTEYGVGKKIRLMRDTDADAIIEREPTLKEKIQATLPVLA
jgi:chaperonin GroES